MGRPQGAYTAPFDAAPPLRDDEEDEPGREKGTAYANDEGNGERQLRGRKLCAPTTAKATAEGMGGWATYNAGNE